MSLIQFFLRCSTWKELTSNLLSAIPNYLCSFMQCSESSLRSHFLLQQLDCFESVLNNLVERYYSICFDELNSTSRWAGPASAQHDINFNFHTKEKQSKEWSNDDSRQNNAEDSSSGKLSQREKVHFFCNFLLNSIDSNNSSSSIDSEYFILRYILNMMITLCLL